MILYTKLPDSPSEILQNISLMGYFLKRPRGLFSEISRKVVRDITVGRLITQMHGNMHYTIYW